MNNAPDHPDFDSLIVRGFLGFPANSNASSIPLDGDIVMLTGANGAGKSSLMEAIAFRETGGFCRRAVDHLIHRGPHGAGKFSLQFGTAAPIEGDEKGRIQNPPPWWQNKTEKDRQRHVRTVYLLPSYLEKLFEENPDATETSFADLLAPPSPVVDALRVALKDGIKAVDVEINRLESESRFLSEDEINKARRDHAAIFNSQASAWRAHNSEAEQWLEGFSAERLVILNGNLRSTWTGELANIAKRFLGNIDGAALELSVSEVSRPSEALRVLATAARLSFARAHSQLERAQDTAHGSLPAELVSAITALPESSWATLRQSREKRHTDKFTADFTEKNLVERRDVVRRLRNALGRGESDFPSWVSELQQRASQWDELLRKEKLPVQPPEALAIWSKQAMELASAWTGCESVWSEWAARLDDTEKQLSYELDQMQAAAQGRRQLRAIAEGLEKLLNLREDLRALFLRSETAKEFLTEAIEIEKATTANRPTVGTPPTGAEAFARACDVWAEWERRVEAEEERQRSPEAAAFLQRLEQLRELQTAIKNESGTSAKGRLGQLQHEALGSVLKPMENFINDAADRFRIFENIKPVRLERFSRARDGNRLGPRVGTPEREIGQTSNGQRNQLGLLMLLALHFGLRATYQSRVLCLDEITSSFDLSQLPRVALLLRQIAYAPVGSEFQRRIFIAGHNEEFNQRLAELLTPPHGRKLRIVRFTGYDIAQGPIIQSQLMQPALAFDTERLTSYFRHRYGPGRD
jgi:hypothetical protein